MLYLSIYLLFLTLTPGAYKPRRYPKWPGALLVTIWWVGVSVRCRGCSRSSSLTTTYGSLAG